MARAAARARSPRPAPRPAPARRCRGPAQPGVIRPVGETHTISVITSPAPPSALPPRCTRWKSVGTPSTGGVHVHRRDDHAVGQLQRAEPERAGTSAAGQRRPASGSRPAPPRAAANQRSMRGHELRVAQPQVVVGDPPAAGDDVERELLRRLLDVLADVLEPLQAGLRRALGGQHHRPALGLVRRQRRWHVGVLVQAGGEGQRVLHRQLGAGADREVRGVRGVAEQDDVAVPPGVVA